MNRHSTIKVAVNGNPAFVWDGGEIEARKVLEVPDAARRLGHTPQQLADSLMFYLVRDGGKLLPNSDAGQGFQMTAVIWRILGAETNDAEHPGKIAD